MAALRSSCSRSKSSAAACSVGFDRFGAGVTRCILDCSRHMDLVGAVKIVKLMTWFRFAKRRRFQTRYPHVG